MSRPHRPAALAAALLLFAAGCSSSATDPAPTAKVPALSASEAYGIASSLYQRAFSSSTMSIARNGSSGATVTFSGPCPLGGSVSGTTSVTYGTDAAGTTAISGTITSTPQACAVSTGARTVTLTGDPSLTATFTTRLGAGGAAAASTTTAKVGGGFKWEGGRCALDYTATIALTSGGAGTVTVAGTACGRDVSGTYAAPQA